MKVLIQRVNFATVKVKNEIKGQIKKGLLIFLGIEKEDTSKQVDYLIKKIIGLRIFENQDKKFDLSVQDVNGEIMVVSQFTLCGTCEKGRRPDFFSAAEPVVAKKLYQEFIKKLQEKNISVSQGVFGAFMQVELENDGPSTFILETRKSN